MNFSLFIARRIYQNQDKRKKVSKPAIAIAVAGIAIGLAVMLISVSVVLGFKHTIQNKVIGFGSHLQVANVMSQLSSNDYPIVANDSLLTVIKKAPWVKHVQKFAYIQGILKTDSDFLGVMFKGVGPAFDTTFISQHMIKGHVPHFSDKRSSNEILISQDMADKLNVHSGQRLFAYFIDPSGIRLRRFSISGIYQTNLNQFDKILCFTDLYNVVKLNNWEPDQVSGIEASVRDFNHVDEAEAYLVNHVNKTLDRNGDAYSTQSIRERHPEIFNWLDLLDMNVWIIIALMIVVASVTMISGLLIIILERTSMIGVMKALGSRNSTIRHIFMWFATFVIGRGLLIGNVIGMGLILLQHFTGVVKLDPTIYYINAVPVEINIPLFLAINAFTFIVCVLILIIPSYLISHISPTKSIRYE